MIRRNASVPHAPGKETGSRSRFFKGAVALGAAAILVIAAAWFLPIADWIDDVGDWVAGRGAIGVLVFSAGYMLGSMLFVPGSLLAIASGAVFGMTRGALLAVASATGGATAAFLLSRYLARGAVRRWIRQHRLFRVLDEALEEKEGRIILLMRLSPLVPFGLGNYFFGITRARLWKYVAATFAGMAPGAFLNAYIGHLGVTAFGRHAEAPGAGQIVLLCAGLAATAALTWYLTAIARRRLQRGRAGRETEATRARAAAPARQPEAACGPYSE